jgi:hypothetical protein
VKTRPTRGLGGPGAVSACGGSEANRLARPKAEWAENKKKEFLN